MLAEIYFVLHAEFGLEKKDILLGKELSENDLEKAYKIFEERVNTGKPIQYIIEKTFFMGDFFQVNKNVLIPRDDTEILVKTTCRLIKENNLKSVLDIGTGSGIIAIELAKCTKAKIVACDISPKALDVAKNNVINLKQNVKFIQSDLFENINEKFDLIVSNPPYIPFSKKENLQFEVKNFEPETALFAKDNGLFFYNEIISQAKKYLNKSGFIAFEIGIGQAKQIHELLEKDFEKIIVKKDVSGIERVVVARLKD